MGVCTVVVEQRNNMMQNFFHQLSIIISLVVGRISSTSTSINTTTNNISRDEIPPSPLPLVLPPPIPITKENSEEVTSPATQHTVTVWKAKTFMDPLGQRIFRKKTS